jgi:hypothetical protein
MLPVQRSRSSSLLSLGLSSFSSVISGIQAWVRREIVDDDPWDRETLYSQALLERTQRLQYPVEELATYDVEVHPPDHQP